MRRLLPLVSCLLVVAGVAVLDAAIKVKTEFDRSADFSALRSYAWLPTPAYRTQVSPEVKDNFLAQETIDAPIRAAVDRALATKKLTPVVGDAPADCYLVYYAAFGMEIDSHFLGEQYAYVTGWGAPFLGAQSSIHVQMIEQGTVVVDMLNREKKVAIWRAVASGTVDRDRTDAQRKRAIDEAAKKMFEKFPPGK